MKSIPNSTEKPTNPLLLPPPGCSRVGDAVGEGPLVWVGVAVFVEVLSEFLWGWQFSWRSEFLWR